MPASGRRARHVGLIPDGLRRWAAQENVPLAAAYLRGAHKVVEIMGLLRDRGVQTVSVYNLSRANLGRTDDELAAVYAASIEFFTTLVPEAFDPATSTVRVHGAMESLPADYVSAAEALQRTMNGPDFRINILAAYDAYDEVRRAHERAQREHLDIAAAFAIGDIDLVIRTTPEPLLSGFLPLQTQYAQLHFLTTPLNDLSTDEIDRLLDEFGHCPQLRGR